MPKTSPRKAHSTPTQAPQDLIAPDEANEARSGIDLDEGLIPPMIDDDPEYDRLVEPED